MDTIRKLETKMASWYAGLPHLPAGFRTWLSVNAWWLTLIGAIICGISALVIIATVFSVGVLLSIFAGGIGTIIGGFLFIISLLSTTFLVISVVLAAMAISPLKAMRKKGWMLLFIILLIEVVQLVMSSVFSLDLFGLVWGLFMAGIGGYVLFEIRDFYGKVPTVSHKATRKDTLKATDK